MRWTKWTLAVASLTVLAIAPLQAQENAAKDRDQTVGSKRSAKEGTETDRTIASCLTISNQEEIDLAKQAVAHAENPRVKQLAEMMIKNHQKCINDLKAFGGEAVALRTTTEDSARNPDSAASVDVSRTTATATQRTAAHENEGLNFLDLKRQMAERCVQSASQQWNEHRGPEGDKCFVGTQIVMHQQMIDAQEVLKQHASPKFQAEIDKSIAGTRTHLKHAEELMKELAANASESPKSNN